MFLDDFKEALTLSWVFFVRNHTEGHLESFETQALSALEIGTESVRKELVHLPILMIKKQ